ncbi:ribosomal protein S5 domain 2-type protein [Dipodascopsis uninucleata]
MNRAVGILSGLSRPYRLALTTDYNERVRTVAKRLSSNVNGQRQKDDSPSTKEISIRPRRLDMSRTPSVLNREPWSEAILDDDVSSIIRIVPKSFSYYMANTFHADIMLELRGLTRKYASLPKVQSGERKFLSRQDYKAMDPQQRTRPTEYNELLVILKDLARIRPDLMPQEVAIAIRRFEIESKATLPDIANRKIDEFGRAYGHGKRKDAAASVWVVRGEGQILVNGKPITEIFKRQIDRERALYPLTVIGGGLEYNIFIIVKGGGLSGQSGAVALALSRALQQYNPHLGPILIKANCLFQDLRIVERKKPGKKKARKSPQWVKR